MTISVSPTGSEARSRIVAIRLASLTLRTMEKWRDSAGGYDEAMILLAVVAITSDRLVRGELDAGLQSLEVAMPQEQLAQCSISSIAAATGLNRETARRKVRQLVAQGMLENAGRARVRFPAGFLQQPMIQELVRTQLETFTRTASHLLRDGALSIDEA